MAVAVILHRLRIARIHRPFTIACAIIPFVPGVLGIIYGDRVSRALSIITANTISRGLGLALALSAVLLSVGIVRGRHMPEIVGLVTIAISGAIYSIGAILGLGLAGVIAATFATTVALGASLRVVSLIGAAREIERSREP